MHVALVKNGVVQSLLNVPDDVTVVVDQNNLARKFDLYDGVNFSPNPDRQTLLDLEVTKHNIVASVISAATSDDLNAAVAAANNQLNPQPVPPAPVQP